MSTREIIALLMFLVPIAWCLGQIFIPLFKTFDRKSWLIFGGVIAWYVVAFAVWLDMTE